MPSVVIDTNVIISAFAFDGLPEKALKLAFGKCRIVVSVQLLDEYKLTSQHLEASGKITHTQFKAIITGIAALLVNAEFVKPNKKLKLCRDPNDDFILECCLAAKTDYLITGDKDLLVLKDQLPPALKKLCILKPKYFLNTQF